MAVFNDNWARLEGPVVKDPGSKYGTLNKIPANIAARIFYTPPEIQLENPNNSTGSVYRILYFDTYFSHGDNSVKAINTYWDTIQNEINSFSKTIEWTQAYTSFYMHDPFTLDKSAVIFYSDSNNDGLHLNYDKTLIVLIDETVKPKVTEITASYHGPSIPMGEVYDKDDVTVMAKFEDGNNLEIKKDSWVSDPMDCIVATEGVNQFKASYTDPDGITHDTIFNVNGVKNITGITAEYDPMGPRIAEGHEIDEKYVLVYAQYSDGTRATVSNVSFPDGKVVSTANGGVLTVEYKSFTTTITVPMFTVNTGRLIAYYNGPDVEIGHEYQKHYVILKVYYESDNATADSYYEDIAYDDSNVTYEKDIIEAEDVNQIKVSYYSAKLDETLFTYFIVNGFEPERKAVSMEAVYTGPEIVANPSAPYNSYSQERVIAKVHFSDGTVEEVKNFAVNSNVVTQIGPNEYTAEYTYAGTSHHYTVSCTFVVTGIAPEDTTKSGYSAIQLRNNYPEAHRINNRYRGPSETNKHNFMSHDIINNLKRLYGNTGDEEYDVFAKIQNTFNEVSKQINSDMSARIQTFCQVQSMNDTIDKYINDEQYHSGMF